jgi:hypothetical protein
MKVQSIADATILSLGAIIEALPRRVQKCAAALAREFLSARLADDPHAERIVRGIFLLDEDPAVYSDKEG